MTLPGHVPRRARPQGALCTPSCCLPPILPTGTKLELPLAHCAQAQEQDYSWVLADFPSSFKISGSV